MLAELIRHPPEILALGTREHAILATLCGEAVSARFEQDDWTCHVCRARIRGYMEIDHIDSHKPCGSDGIRTICQFCHNLRHPVWAALRGRLRLIWAPDLDQVTLTRLAWQVLFACVAEPPEAGGEELAAASLHVAGDVSRRERVLGHILGSAHPEAFFEALFAARSLMPAKAFHPAVSRLDRFVRFWPTAAGWRHEHSIPAASAFGCWKEGRFIDMSFAAAGQYWQHEAAADRLCELWGQSADQFPSGTS